MTTELSSGVKLYAFKTKRSHYSDDCKTIYPSSKKSMAWLNVVRKGRDSSRDPLTRPVAYSSVKGGTDDSYVKGSLSFAQAFDML